MSVQIGTADGYIDLLLRLDAFLTQTGHAWGLTYAGVGNGRLRGPGGAIGGYLGTADTLAETLTLTATSATAFTVTGTHSGALGTATVDADFVSVVAVFRIVVGTVPFQPGDQFQINLSPRWQRLRLGGCSQSTQRRATFSDLDTLFDDSATTGITTALPASVTIEMIVPTEVRSLAISAYSPATAPRNFILQWSDDNAAWHTAHTWTEETWTQSYARRDFVVSTRAGAHRYWRVNVTAAASATLRMTSLRLFGDDQARWDLTTRAEFAWQAPGTDGQSPLFVAGYTQTSVGDDYYNWVFRGFRRFDAALSVLDMPDHGGDKALLLNNLPIAYWFIAQAGHLKVIVRISNVYEWAYAGYGLPYETPAQHPYPYLSGAPWIAGNARWDLATAGGYRNPCDPGSASSGITVNAGLAAYFPDGQWRPICNRYNGNNTSEGYNDSSGRGKTWPYAVDETGSVQPNHLRDAIDGIQPLIPVVIFNPAPAHVWGEFDGVYFVTGYNTIAEALLQVGAIDHLVVPNIHRGTLNNYCAIALD